MLRNYLAAALRNLVRNRLYAAISVGCLAISFAAALLIVLFARDEFSYDTWIPGHERIVQITSNAKFPHFTDTLAMAPGALARMLRDEIPDVEATVRITGTETTVGAGEVEGLEVVHWPDVNFLEVFDLPLVVGDRATALRDAETVVITRRMAQKYFGSTDIIGRTLMLGRTEPLKITGVLEDLPSNTHFDFGILISGASARSPFAAQDGKPAPVAGLPWVVYLYAKLRDGASVEAFRAALPELASRHPEFSASSPSFTFDAQPLAAIHFGAVRVFAMKPPANPDVVYGFLLIGFFVVALAVVNYVGVASAVVAKRAVEIGVRKLSGAERAHLYWQFLSENLVNVAAAMAVALALAGALLPAFNGFLQRTITFPHDFAWFAGIAAAVIVVSLLAGSYPAQVLAPLRPARILKSERLHGKGRLRSVLICFQFAILIGLGVVAGVVYTQLRYVLTEGLRFNKDLVLQINAPCGTAFEQEVRKLAGVGGVVCGNTPILRNGAPVPATASDGRELSVGAAAIDFGYLEFFGLAPKAGRFFSPAFGGDMAPADRGAPGHPTVVINEALMRALGFSAPEQAIGETLRWGRLLAPNAFKLTELRPSEIIGVVPDFARGSLREAIPPTVFWVDPTLHRIINVKLDGARVPETLAAIDALWRRVGAERAISRSFVDQAVNDLYLDLARQTRVLGYLTAVTVVIAAFGLFGLAAFTAEQRTKEIGIRKSMGATRAQILRLLLWQFAKPVLWANVIAWPAAYFAMRRWLDGFAYRIDLEPWMFLATSSLGLMIAVLTVIGHALLVARAHPVTALRYE